MWVSLIVSQSVFPKIILPQVVDCFSCFNIQDLVSSPLAFFSLLHMQFYFIHLLWSLFSFLFFRSFCLFFSYCCCCCLPEAPSTTWPPALRFPSPLQASDRNRGRRGQTHSWLFSGRAFINYSVIRVIIHPRVCLLPHLASFFLTLFSSSSHFSYLLLAKLLRLLLLWLSIFRNLLFLLLLLFEFFTTVQTECFPLESEWQQVSSGFQDSSKYPNWWCQFFI